jgi:hypothetical protein
MGYRPTVLDIAAEPLDVVKARLGAAARHVDWLVADVTLFDPPGKWDVWHDRAVFHFLTDSKDRDRYRQNVLRATEAGASVIVATFGPDGPDRCSGLPTVRYAPEDLRRELGPGFELVESAGEDHQTPGGSIQHFVYCRFRRVDTSAAVSRKAKHSSSEERANGSHLEPDTARADPAVAAADGDIGGAGGPTGIRAAPYERHIDLVAPDPGAAIRG